MMSKLVEACCGLTALLREEITELRSLQKREPERKEYYEEKILTLFEEYDHLLSACRLFYRYCGEKSI